MKNKKVVENFIKTVWNQKKLELIPQFLSNSYIAHKLGAGGEVRGIEEVKLNILDCYVKFKNFKISINNMIEEKNMISSWIVLHDGARIMNEIIIHKLSNNKIVEAWSIGGNWL